MQAVVRRSCTHWVCVHKPGIAVAHHLLAVNLLLLHVPSAAFKWPNYAAFQSWFLKRKKGLSPSKKMEFLIQSWKTATFNVWGESVTKTSHFQLALRFLLSQVAAHIPTSLIRWDEPALNVVYKCPVGAPEKTPAHGKKSIESFSRGHNQHQCKVDENKLHWIRCREMTSRSAITLILYNLIST